MTAPMTAAEYHAGAKIGQRIIAALEEREALLGEREEWGKLSGQTIQDAAVGALVRRIREHPESVAPVVHDGYGLDVFTVPVSEDGFRALLSHLDSLLPKEPDVAPSGWTYEPAPEYGSRCWRRTGTAGRFSSERDIQVPPIDREFVAKLLGGKDD